jgi:cytochrome c-type biogenesis protein CcsB
MRVLKQIYNYLFSTSAAGLYTLLFATAIAVATFVENDFGTSSAQKIIFKTKWFELLMLLFGISILANIVRYRMVKQRKWAILTFHLAILVILAGAAVTRYWAYEGMMGIREGEASDTFLSAETYLQFDAEQDGKQYSFAEPVLFATLGNNHFRETYQLGADKVEVEVLGFIPNPREVMVPEEATGMPTLKVVFAGTGGREEYFIRAGDRAKFRGVEFNFGQEEIPGAFNLRYDSSLLTFMSDDTYVQMIMAAQQTDTLPSGKWHSLMLRSMYSNGKQSFVFGDFLPKGTVRVEPAKQKMESSSLAALDMDIRINGQSNRILLAGQQGVAGRPQMVEGGKTSLRVAYGAKPVKLPFAIRLRDFIMERYPGTDNASSYASEVTLLDQRRNLQRDQRIYMNHILNYHGYRFFQSSYDKDELGTYLSVNHDFWGTWISYLGYALLTLGMIFTLFDAKSRFRHLGRTLQNMRLEGKTALAVLFLLAAFRQTSLAGTSNPPTYTIDPGHAKAFGHLVVQDFNGRFKPVNTLTSEILRKLSRKETLYGLSSEQIVLGMAANPKEWYDVPLIKLGMHETIRELVGVEGKLASYANFFNADGTYKLRSLVEEAFSKEPRDRGVLDKEVQNLDEKINICGMVFGGQFFRLFPIPGDPNHTWAAPVMLAPEHAEHASSSDLAIKFYPVYLPTLQKAMDDGDWALPNKLIDELGKFQKKNASTVYPSEGKLNAELILNKSNVFGRLGSGYALLGLFFLVLLFASVFKPSLNLEWLFRIGFGIFTAAVLLHAFGLGLRWYVSGRAPWSNGYESMIYIGFTTVLAGLIFSRRSLGGLAATNVLASSILMVAGLSWLDPEITPLVPVLKSYWLTIHVSLIAGSYGFLVLGAIIGLINLIFMILATQRSKNNIYRVIKELTLISEMTLIGGLFMLSIGTYLGGVWANESWGRYWGWDAKETWALVTILVYSFILHMRFIPGLRGVYAFNVASLFGWASVMMTYFGVNYYLSGLHSYAAGDPVPIPDFVYITVICLIVTSLLAYWRHRWYLRSDEPATPKVTQLKVAD